MEERPNIPRLTITKVGTIENGVPVGWRFDERSHPQSVGKYVSEDWVLYGGYTANELQEILDNEMRGEIVKFGKIIEGLDGSLEISNFHVKNDHRFDNTSVTILTLIKERLEKEITLLKDE